MPSAHCTFPDRPRYQRGGRGAAINEGINRATSTLRGVEGARVKEMIVLSANGGGGHEVNAVITFDLGDGSETAGGLTGDADDGATVAVEGGGQDRSKRMSPG